jgi:hypothetical protein
MKNKVVWLLLMAMCIGQSANAQEPGYFGRKTLVEFGGMGQLPVFQNIFGQEKGYVESGQELTKKYNLIDYSFRVSLSAIANENTAYGLEFTQRYYSINPLKLGTINRQFLDASGVTHSDEVAAEVGYLPLTESVFMPKITFSPNQTRVPAGLSSEFGIGLSKIQLRALQPMVNVTSGGFSAMEIQQHFVDDRAHNLKGMVFMYGLRMNYPLTKQILFNVGVRYQYDYLLQKKKFRDMEQTECWLSGREIWSRVNQRRQLGILNVGMGLIFCL